MFVRIDFNCEGSIIDKEQAIRHETPGVQADHSLEENRLKPR